MHDRRHPKRKGERRVSDEEWPSYDRAPDQEMDGLCNDLLAPLIKLHGHARAEKHDLPLDVHFRRRELHVYCGHARLVKAEYLPSRKQVDIRGEYAAESPLFKKGWQVEENVEPALCQFLAEVDIKDKACREGALQARWASATPPWTSATPPWTMIDREARLRFPNKEAREDFDRQVESTIGPARQVIREISRSRTGLSWREPDKGGGQVDQLAVDDKGNLVLIEIKDAKSSDSSRLFYAPLQLLKYVLIWHQALRRLTLWNQLLALVDSRQRHGLAPKELVLTGGIRTAVCFGEFQPSDEVKRRFYEVLGVVNAFRPAGVQPIEVWEFKPGDKPIPL